MCIDKDLNSLINMHVLTLKTNIKGVLHVI